jgi:hypothetical protein
MVSKSFLNKWSLDLKEQVESESESNNAGTN